MYRNRKKLLVLSICATLGAVPFTLQAEEAARERTLGSVERSHASNARALLDQAVLTYQAKGPEQALATFNDRNGEFARGQYYIFVLGEDGTMQASSGPSASLVGLNVSDLKDAAGKPFMREILDKSTRQDSGEVEYQWLNPADNKLENKVSQFRKVGDHVLCVGYYIPRATAEQAQALLERAVQQVKDKGAEAAFRSFNDPRGGFVYNDEYVFAIGLDDGRYRASGSSPNLVGIDVRNVTDAAGKPLFKDMIELARKQGSGTVDYVWRNPATNAVEQKHSLIQRVDDVLLGVGYYTRP
ncbi:cache domain-containing protein [Stutzerimonas frequens]|uniref:cache domain-containing protein n=1 Tax=Stutzerimonas frequens TaxID=2968969 RepID=UPI002DC050D1|nr:cache domain-containing protein [Stutzerimonas frequens]WRW26920.1 cache domain-containing protein [Stutzerimonas frequens]